MMGTTSIEVTPLSQAAAPVLDDLNVSALLADAKLLDSAPYMHLGSTSVEGAALAIDSFEGFNWTTTATSSDKYFPRRSRARPLSVEEPSVEDQIDRTNKERIELLARQYVAKEKFSSEEEARLAIVTARVRQLLPAVTAAEYEALEKNLQASQKITSQLDNLRERLTRLSEKRG